MIAWTKEDVAYTYPWTSSLSLDDQQSMLNEINEHLSTGGTTLDTGWDSMIRDWELTATYWAQHPEEADRLVDALNTIRACHDMAAGWVSDDAKTEARKAARRQSMKQSLRELITAIPLFGVPLLSMWLTPHPSVVQTLAWIGVYVYVMISWVFWVNFLHGIARMTWEKYQENKKREGL